MVGRNPNKERLLILKDEKDLKPEEQTRIFYRRLSCGAYYDSLDNLVEMRTARKKGEASGGDRTHVLSGRQEKNTLLNGITRIENFLDEDGNALVWKTGDDKANLDLLGYFLAKHRREIAKAISDDSELSEEQEGNSDSPSESD